MVPRSGTLVANRRAGPSRLGRVQDRDVEVGVEQHDRRVGDVPDGDLDPDRRRDPATTWALVTR